MIDRGKLKDDIYKIILNIDLIDYTAIPRNIEKAVEEIVELFEPCKQ